MAPNKIHKVDDSLIEQLCSIASVSKVVATNLLEACGNNLEMAVNMHMEGVVTDTNESMSNATDQDDVRAPIPQRQEVLVEGPDQIAFSFSGRTRKTRSVFDKFRNFETEARRQEELLGESSSSADEKLIKHRKKMQTLEDLYRPPIDLMFRGSFQSARDAGISTKKWLLVNIQNSSEFSCQVLNRDLWSNSAVKTIIQEHFLFWQIYHDSDEGQRYMNFYPVKDWPYIAVIDPRTGECIISWRNMDAVSFCDIITEFITRHSSMEDSVTSVTPQKKKQKTDVDNIIEADETAQIEAAIRASLEGSSNGETSSSDSSKITENQNKRKLEENDDEESDSLETFDSDSDNVDYSISKQGHSNKLLKRSDPVNDTLEKDTSFNSAIRARVNRNSDEESLANGSVQEKDDEGVFDESIVEATKETWEDYLGKEDDSKSKLILRLPDGTRDIVEMPSSSQLMALVLYIASKGFSNEVYELVTNFPKKQLSYLDFTSTLKSIGLFPQETVFVQKR